jgi:hypothetical protein
LQYSYLNYGTYFGGKRTTASRYLLQRWRAQGRLVAVELSTQAVENNLWVGLGRR